MQLLCSSSAGYVRGKSCLSRAACLVHLYKVYQYDDFDSHAAQHHWKLDLGRPGGRSMTFGLRQHAGRTHVSHVDADILGHLAEHYLRQEHSLLM